ncbi:MAG TPA: hypothetical protein VFF73_15740, partial [Planctomycetota bacterium]|nr:hypothetical protein [Planctomycetota bacterium]
MHEKNWFALLGAAVVPFLPAVAWGQTPPPPTIVSQVVSLGANDLVYDPVRQVLYASVPATSPVISSSIAIIDPVAVKITGSIALAAEPGRLAISDDAHYLYAALAGSTGVQQIDLTTGKAAKPFSIGSDPTYGPYSAGQIVVLPGQPTSIAV